MKNYKLVGPITVLYVTLQLVSDVTAGKLIPIFNFPVSVTAIYFPLTYIFADVLTEVYGYAVGRRVLWTVLLCAALAAGLYQFAALLPPASGFTGNAAYVQILSQVPRIVLGSWVAVFFGEILNDFVLAKMKVMTDGKHMWLRLVGSTVTGQLMNTALFYTIGLYGVLPTKLLVESIISGWLIKCAVEIALIPFTYIVIKKVKRDRKRRFLRSRHELQSVFAKALNTVPFHSLQDRRAGTAHSSLCHPTVLRKWLRSRFIVRMSDRKFIATRKRSHMKTLTTRTSGFALAAALSPFASTATAYDAKNLPGTYSLEKPGFVHVKQVVITKEDSGKLKARVTLAGFPDDVNLGEGTLEPYTNGGTDSYSTDRYNASLSNGKVNALISISHGTSWQDFPDISVISFLKYPDGKPNITFREYFEKEKKYAQNTHSQRQSRCAGQARSHRPRALKQNVPKLYW